MRLSNSGLKRLLRDLKGVSSYNKFSDELGVSATTVKEWFNREDVNVQTDHIKAIATLARSRGIEPLLYDDPPPLWDVSKSFEENQKLAVPEPLGWRMPNEKTETVFLGHAINSPIGASSTIVTSSASRIAFLASAGVDVVTYKTVRSGFYRAHSQPNLYFVEADAVLDPDQPIPRIRVTHVKEGGQFFGLVNRFGVPSRIAEEWQADVRAALAAHNAGQLMILSIMGTAGKDDSVDVLVDDFAKVTCLAVETDVKVIEVNLSCPNCQGREGELYKDLELTKRILRVVSAIARRAGVSILAKIGYMPSGELETFVNETSEYVDGYTAINSVAVEPVTQGQYRDELVYPPGTKAGITGRPIRALALRTINTLNELRLRNNLKYAISGCGGITEPEDVMTFLQCGADIVTIGTKLITDSLFGLRVRQYLEHQPARNDVQQSTDDAMRLAGLHWISAMVSIPGLLDNPTWVVESQRVFATWRDEYTKNPQRAYRSDNRFRGGVPTRVEFERMIRTAIRR